MIVPHQQGKLIQIISFNKIKTQVIEGANHVTYVHDSGQQFAQVEIVVEILHLSL